MTRQALPRRATQPRQTIAVLGTLTRDTTVYADGRRTENLGGLLYTLSTLAHLSAGKIRILPVANVGQDLASAVERALQLPGVDTALVRRVPVANNHVYLTYRDAETRDEVLVGLVPPVDLAHALAALQADHFLVNLTSGLDVELATLQALRRQFHGTIQLDIHSLTLGFAADGLRVLRRPEDWRQWVRCADWVQMNETEARLLGDGAEPEAFAARLLDLGPRVVLVTLAAHGVFACWEEAGVRQSLRLAAAHRWPAPFPTGCGDVFGAAFAYARLAGASTPDSVRIANGVASTKAGIEPYAELTNIRRHAAAHLEPLGRAAVHA